METLEPPEKIVHNRIRFLLLNSVAKGPRALEGQRVYEATERNTKMCGIVAERRARREKLGTKMDMRLICQ